MSVPRIHSHKPDPNEPWRYVCPECHGQLDSKGTTMNHYCASCGWKGRTHELYDQKREVIAGP